MDDIKSTVMDVTRKVAKTSEGIFKTTKLSFSISTEESRLRELYVEIGKKVHEIYAYGGSLGKVFDEKYAEIKKLEDKIDLLKAQLQLLKGKDETPASTPPAQSQPSIPSTPEAEKTHTEESAAGISAKEEAETPSVNASPMVLCPLCKKPNPQKERFCLHCGRMLV